MGFGRERSDERTANEQSSAFRAAVTQPLPTPRTSAPTLEAAWSPALAGAAEVVGLVRHLANGQGRDDLVEQLDDIRSHLTVEPVPVIVLGGAGQGKSSVVNALVGASVCPVGTLGTTAAPVAVSHQSDYRGELVIDPTAAGRLEPLWRPVEFAEASSLAANAMNPNNQWALRLIELGVPSPRLARGLVLIDTPPVAEVWTPDTTRILRVVAGAAAVVLVTSAASPLTPGELDLLRAAAALCQRVVVVVNGTNAFPGWSSVVEQDQLLLEQRGVSATVFPVTATAYWGEAGGVPPGPDAGMQSLAAFLENSVVLDSEHQRISRALGETFWAADRLRLRLYAERNLIGDQAGIDTAAARLRAAARRAHDLCSPASGWHVTLDDDLRRLRRDVEDDLDQELARLAAEAESQIESIGTTATWDEVHLWLHRRLADAVVHVHRVRKLATRAFCKSVSDQFHTDWAAIVSSLEMAGETHALLNPRIDRPNFTSPLGFADLGLGTRTASFGLAPTAAVPIVSVGHLDPRDAARATYRAWLATTEEFLRADTEDLLDRVARELETRCQGRAIELHRSIIEVFTTLQVLRDLNPDMIDLRHEALENDIEQLQTLDLHLGRDQQAPKQGY